MKKAITIIFLFVSVIGFGQEKKDSIPKVDSIHLTISLADLQLYYEALSGSNLPHQAVVKALGYLEQEYRIQTAPKAKK